MITEWEELLEKPPDEQRAVMEEWFRARFEDPAERMPYDSGEGGYIWIWGGPYDAGDELFGEFGEYVPTEVIERLVSDLNDESFLWAPVASADDYDFELDERVRSNLDPLSTYIEAAAVIDGLLGLPRDPGFDDAMHRILFANVISALETYLCDTFVSALESDADSVRRFVETYPEFGQRKIPYADAFRTVDDAPEEARRILLELSWHNMSRVQALYRDVLAIDLRPILSEVARAIPLRHDIVHRNGKDLEGNPVVINADDVTTLMERVKTMVLFVNERVVEF